MPNSPEPYCKYTQKPVTKIGSAKLPTVLAITVIVFMAFTSFSTMAQKFGEAPAPSLSMESAGMALQVPVLFAAVSFVAYLF
ncbi:hypothetical protein Tco_1579070 [Tanacetum coccineum]